MTRCRWCGLESRDDYVCEWCKRVMATGQPAPQGYKSPVSTPAGSEEPTLMTPPSSPPPSASPSGIGATPMGPSTPPVSATPMAPNTPPVTATPMAPQGVPRPTPIPATPSGQIRILYEIVEELPFHLRLERFLAVMLPLTAISVFILSQFPEWALWNNLAYFFIMGMWMTASRLIGTIDDTGDYRDVALVMLLSLFCFGPTLTLILYFLATGLLALLLKTEMNWSLIGLLTAYTLATILFSMVLTLIDYDDFSTLVRVGFSFLDFFLVLALFAGWLVGGMVRPE